MKILYMSCHEILEYDELRLLTDLGHECYSLGAYTMPGGDANRKRPPLELPYDPHFIELATLYGKKLHREQLLGMDAVIIMHTPDFITDNTEVLFSFLREGGRVIWRSIGQSVPWIEMQLQTWFNSGMEIVRYSPLEHSIVRFAGETAMIRFAKFEEDFAPWAGGMFKPKVINFTQSASQRSDHCGYDVWNTVTNGFYRTLYGPGNADLPENGGLLDYNTQRGVYAQARAYFYHGTFPASYTLTFIEAAMSGLPIIAVGPETGNGWQYPNQRTYEVATLLEEAGLGELASDDIGHLRSTLQRLFDDVDYAADISLRLRPWAYRTFGAEGIKPLWKELLG